MSRGAILEMIVKTSGEAQLAKLQKQLVDIRNSTQQGTMASKIASKQMEVEVAGLKKSNNILGARSKLKHAELKELAIEQREQKIHSTEFDRRMDLETRALNIQHNSKTIISDKDAQIMAQGQIQKEAADAAFVAGEKRKQAELQQTRKNLMAASISMFVLNISLGQLVTAMKPFVEGNADAEKGLKDLAGALQFSMAPLQAYMALQMISTSLAEEQKVAFLGVAASLGAIFFLYQAITAQSPAMRAAYAALSAILIVVAIAQWAFATGLATAETLMGNIAAYAPVAIGLAAIAGVVGYVTAPKAQTLTDHRKRVRSGGMAILDDDEVVMRESKDGTKSGGGGDTNIFLPDSYMGTLSDAKVTAHTVRMYAQTGQGSVQFKRKVASNG